MSMEKFMKRTLSSWMNEGGPSSDIVLSTRIRLARNLREYTFPPLLKKEEAAEMFEMLENKLENLMPDIPFEYLRMSEMQPLEKRVLVEKHLISPNLAQSAASGACLLSEDEKISIMINEEDHLRIQCIVSGFQLNEALVMANRIDDLLESQVDYAFDERFGYLTSCPTNAGTGLRASVMVHLPGLVLTKQINRIIPAINQLGLVVRGIYGEGSAALGNIFQISNQITLGKSEEEIVEDLKSLVQQIIEQERLAREALLKTSNIQLEDRIFRSLGTLESARIIETAEAAKCLSDVRLGIDLGYIKNISCNILSELMTLTQPGFLQLYEGAELDARGRDIRRAAVIRSRLKMERHKE